MALIERSFYLLNARALLRYLRYFCSYFKQCIDGFSLMTKVYLPRRLAARQISTIIIQQIVTLSKYGHNAFFPTFS